MFAAEPAKLYEHYRSLQGKEREKTVLLCNPELGNHPTIQSRSGRSPSRSLISGDGSRDHREPEVLQLCSHPVVG